jgi:hypothetical protein
MNTESELSDLDIDDDSDSTAYTQVATIANSTSTVDLPVEDKLEIVSFSQPDTTSQALWQKIKECESEDVFIWCDFDSLDLIIF